MSLYRAVTHYDLRDWDGETEQLVDFFDGGRHVGTFYVKQVGRMMSALDAGEPSIMIRVSPEMLAAEARGDR